MAHRIVPAHELPAPTGGMRRAQRPTGVILALVVIALALITQSLVTVIALLGQAFAGGPPADFATTDLLELASSGPGLLISLFGFAAGLAFVWLWVRVKERRPFASLGFEQRSAAGTQLLRGIGVGLLMMVICVLVPVLTGQASLTWASPSAGSLGFIALMLLAFLLQGSAEEVLTRGFLTQAVARRFGLLIAIAVQALVFALIHGGNPGMGPLPIINLLLFAVFASCYSLAEGSLWGICAMHGAWNWAQGNLFGVAVSGQRTPDSLMSYSESPDSSTLLTGGQFGLEGSLVTTAIYLLGIAIALRAFRRRRAAHGAPAEHPAA